MATVSFAPVLKPQYFDANGNPLAGGSIYTYQSGTTTPQLTYTDSTGVTSNANPIVLDANGEANIWLDVSLSYKFVIKDSGGATVRTVDGVVGLATNNSVVTASIQDSAVTTAKIADDAVTAAKLRDDPSVDANRAVTTDHIRDAAITTAKLATTVFSGLTADTAPDGTADYVPTFDASASANKKVLLSTVSGMTLISAQTASSSAQIDFTTGIDGTYDEYLFVITGLVPATDNTDLWIRFSENAGSSYVSTSSYAYNFVYSAGAAAPSATGSSGSDTKIVVIGGLGNSTGEVFQGDIRLFTPTSSKYKLMKWNVVMHGQVPSLVTVDGGSVYFGSTNTINAVRFLMSSGNISAGTFRLYGVRK